MLPAQGEELRESLKAIRAQAPGASTLTTAELRLIPYLATHLSFRGLGERLYLSRHTVNRSRCPSTASSTSPPAAARSSARDLGLL
jgi:LuxR family transcriptional regulator, maltose regulon positive regulatory protein